MTNRQIAGLSRRNLLKTMAAAGALAGGGGMLAACSTDGGKSGNGGNGGSGGNDPVDVTLQIAEGWPYGPMPSAEDQDADPGAKAYAEALQLWLDDNPGVQIEEVAVGIWSTEELNAAITGGTAPAAFPGDVIGGWSVPGVRNAMSRGLSRDVTDVLAAHDLDNRLADYARPLWKRWEIEGRYFAAPWLYNIGTGLHYRVDLIRDLGLPEPHPDWTWDDVREIAAGLTEGKRFGIVLQGWGLDMPRAAEHMDFLSTIPAPDTNWNWRWDYSAMADTWVGLIEDLRAMILEDESVLRDVAFDDGAIRGAYFNGQAAMHNNSVVYFTVTPGDGTAPVDLARDMDKEVWEVNGFMTQPKGRNGRSHVTQGQVDLVGFSPDLDDDEADKAVSLLLHVKTDGWVHQRKAAFAETEDLARVYDWDNFMPLMKGVIDQVPGSPEEVWGEEFMETVHRAAEIPLVPIESEFLPPETNDAPPDTAVTDMTSSWTYEAGDRDIRADLKKLEDTRNQQAEQHTSSRSDEEFVEGAKSYFAAHAEFWAANAPEYYDGVFKDWYEGTVRPALGG